MPAEQIVVSKRIQKHLKRLPLKIHRRLLFALGQIQLNPICGEKLHGEMADYRKFRVGDYRIVYYFDSIVSIVKVTKIEHRQGVYK